MLHGPRGRHRRDHKVTKLRRAILPGWVLARSLAHVRKIVQLSVQMEDEELKNFKRQWKKADKDNSGTLDRKEVITLVQRVRKRHVVRSR